jgi:pilus assembly protein Flp/PilA
VLKLINRFRRDEDGAFMVEYGIVVGLVAVLCLAVLQLLGTTLNSFFTAINTGLAPLV